MRLGFAALLFFGAPAWANPDITLLEAETSDAKLRHIQVVVDGDDSLGKSMTAYQKVRAGQEPLQVRVSSDGKRWATALRIDYRFTTLPTRRYHLGRHRSSFGLRITFQHPSSGEIYRLMIQADGNGLSAGVLAKGSEIFDLVKAEFIDAMADPAYKSTAISKLQPHQVGDRYVHGPLPGGTGSLANAAAVATPNAANAAAATAGNKAAAKNAPRMAAFLQIDDLHPDLGNVEITVMTDHVLPADYATFLTLFPADREPFGIQSTHQSLELKDYWFAESISTQSLGSKFALILRVVSSNMEQYLLGVEVDVAPTRMSAVRVGDGHLFEPSIVRFRDFADATGYASLFPARSLVPFAGVPSNWNRRTSSPKPAAKLLGTLLARGLPTYPTDHRVPGAGTSAGGGAGGNSTVVSSNPAGTTVPAGAPTSNIGSLTTGKMTATASGGVAVSPFTLDPVQLKPESWMLKAKEIHPDLGNLQLLINPDWMVASNLGQFYALYQGQVAPFEVVLSTGTAQVTNYWFESDPAGMGKKDAATYELVMQFDSRGSTYLLVVNVVDGALRGIGLTQPGKGTQVHQAAEVEFRDPLGDPAHADQAGTPRFPLRQITQIQSVPTNWKLTHGSSFGQPDKTLSKYDLASLPPMPPLPTRAPDPAAPSTQQLVELREAYVAKGGRTETVDSLRFHVPSRLAGWGITHDFHRVLREFGEHVIYTYKRQLAGTSRDLGKIDMDDAFANWLRIRFIMYFPSRGATQPQMIAVNVQLAGRLDASIGTGVTHRALFGADGRPVGVCEMVMF